MQSPTEIGKAYLAYQIFNHKAKKNRLADFDLSRWLHVVRALAGKTARTKSGTNGHAKTWSPQRRKRFADTIRKRTEAQ